MWTHIDSTVAVSLCPYCKQCNTTTAIWTGSYPYSPVYISSINVATHYTGWFWRKVNILGGDSIGHWEGKNVHMNLCLILIGYWITAVGCRARSKPGGTWWRKGGEVKRKLENGVGSQYSHSTSKRGVSSITTTDAHTSDASSRLNWRPDRFKRTRPFRGKTKCGFCACAITFRMSYTKTKALWMVIIHSFSILSYDRSKASSKASSPHSAI